MKTESDNAVHTGRHHDDEGGPARESSGLSIAVLWGGALLSLLFMALAARNWWQRSAVTVLHWDATQALGSEDASPAASRNIGATTDSASVLSQLTSFSAIGKTLDDPRFDLPSGRTSLDPHQVIPVERRWQFEFEPGLTEGQYLRQLATLEVELGIIDAAGTIQYVKGWGDAALTKRSGKWSAEKRPYWTWGRGDLRGAEVLLLQNSGLALDDQIVLHFLSADVVQSLTKLEADYAKRKAADILVTRFAMKRTFRGFEVFVAYQEER